MPSIVKDGEVINFCVRSWADWTSLRGELDWLDGSCFCRAAAVVMEELGRVWVSLSTALSPEIICKLIQIRAVLCAQASSLTFPPGRIKERGRRSRCSQVQSNLKRNYWNISEWVLWCFRDNTCVYACGREIRGRQKKNPGKNNVPVLTLFWHVLIKSYTSMSAEEQGRCLNFQIFSCHFNQT